ncbi:hypothetical protein L9F63_005715 [Diploptera punctata]|uniref:Uncharacterized protein n=1 Tax=Diploptera punctata TaxID=6984 RepID=A0AAD8E5W4_DIPPU|nr:hypothetical protein L9F63_005715 [Diploptera punctata]
MDPEAFLDLANQVVKLKMFPYFDIAHSVLCALHVREDLGPGAQAFSRKHPMSCWLSTMLVGVCRGHVVQRTAGRAHPRSSQEHTAAGCGHSRVVQIYRCKKGLRWRNTCS